MAETVREIMDASPASVGEDTPVEEVVRTLREHELPGVPVVGADGRVAGIVTEADMVLPDDQGDLHIPHYINLFGGTVFLEPLGRFEQRLRKAFAATASDMMTRDPDTVDARHLRARSGAADPRVRAQPPARGRGRSARRRGHAPGRAGRPRGVSAPERALARIDLGAIERNCTGCARCWARTRSCARSSRPTPTGTAPSRPPRPRSGAGRAGSRWRRGEAEQLRRAGIEGPILVMGALTRAELETAIAADADVVAWTRELAQAAPRVHVKFDSGMGRLGSKDVELGTSSRGCGRRRLDADDPLRHRRRARRRPLRCAARGLRARSPSSTRSCCCTPPTARRPSASPPPTSAWSAAASPSTAWTRFKPTRPRAASSRRWSSAPGSPRCAASLRATAPATGAAGRANEPTWVATIPIGYGDGWRRALTNDCDVLIRGRRRPLAGTVSMDNVTVDLGPETDVQPGDRVVLIGAQGDERILAEEVARRLGTINYEITCGLSPRVRRQHLP